MISAQHTLCSDSDISYHIKLICKDSFKDQSTPKCFPVKPDEPDENHTN